MTLLTPINGMSITADAVLAPGVYYLSDGIAIAADGVTLDGNGALLVGAGRRGCGVQVTGRSGVTIRNLRLAEYEHGIHALACRGLKIEHCQVRATAELPANTRFLDIWLPPEQAYGGGILLWEVHESLVFGCDLQHQMNGLLTYFCRRLAVQANNASYCSGWGFHLYHTGESLFEDNIADYCCRWEPRPLPAETAAENTLWRGHLGADAAGFLIVYGSCSNIFRRNLARLGGDGFFLAGLAPTGELCGCDDNLFEENDGSYSPNIAFEATFSRGNIFRHNRASGGNYGFWLGFSQQNLIEGNQVERNRRAGLAVENGILMTARGNTFSENAYGVLLWSKRVPDFERAVPENDTSRDWRIEGNIFLRNRVAIRIAADRDHGTRPLTASGEWGLPAPPPRRHIIRVNAFRGNQVGVELEGTVEDELTENTFEDRITEPAARR